MRSTAAPPSRGEQKLTVDDIIDLRAYERERDEFRSQIIELKKRRRVALGTVVTLVFENRDTMRFQIQEMARAERMLTDEAIADRARDLQPADPRGRRAVGDAVHRAHDRGRAAGVAARSSSASSAVWGCGSAQGGEGAEAMVVRAVPEADHAARLTRPDATSSVHYVWLRPDRCSGRPVRRRGRDAVRGSPRVSGRDGPHRRDSGRVAFRPAAVTVWVGRKRKSAPTMRSGSFGSTTPGPSGSEPPLEQLVVMARSGRLPRS